MKIIIPMSGIGKRFLDAGYTDPKPLIPVDGKPMIEHVVSMFDIVNDEFVFICNKDHIKNTDIRLVLKNLVKNYKIVEIEQHKLGPVYTVISAFDNIEDSEPVIVCYCDFYEVWNYEDFKKIVTKSKCDAAVTAYKGFHPHLLGPNLYASMRSDDNWMLESREKHSFTENKMDSFQQSGKFYFSRGSILKKYFSDIIKSGLTVNNEYYISTITQRFVEDGLKVYIYPVNYFLQWGTPNDLEEYIKWSEFFKNIKTPNIINKDSQRTFDYWDHFFTLCPWHPYRKISGKIKGILLDFDNTLYDYDQCNTYAKAALAQKISKDNNIPHDLVENVYDASRKDVKNRLGNTGPSDSRILYIQKTLETLNISNYISKSFIYEDFFWQKFFEKMHLFEGVIDFLMYTSKNNLKICILSDMTTKMQMIKIDHLRIENYIHFIVTSEEVGEKKPSPKMFLAALEKLHLQPENVVVIGDNEKTDIEGSKAVGIPAIKTSSDFFKTRKYIEFLNMR